MENEKYAMIYEINRKYDFKRILGEEFVRNNKNKGKMIYKNKKYPLKSLFQLKDIINDRLKIQILLSKDCSNKSFMFKDCIFLTEIKIANNRKYINKKNLYNEKRNYIVNHNYNNIDDYLQKINRNKFNNYLKCNIKISAMNEIFSNCFSLKKLPDISNWDTSNVIDMSKLFYKCFSLSLLPDLSKWDTSNVIDMNGMFYKCIKLKSLPDLSKWKKDNVVNIIKMFDHCLSLSLIPNISNKKSKNINMNSLNEKSYSIFKLIYEIKNETLINIFDSDFVKKNKGNCKMIIDNKIYLLSDKFHISDDNQKILKIKLMIINNQRINLRYMFYNCKSLKKFYKIPKAEYNFNSESKIIKDGQIETIYTHVSSETNNKLSYNFYQFNEAKNDLNETFLSKNKSFNNRNKLNLIFTDSNNKNFLSDEDKKK